MTATTKAAAKNGTIAPVWLDNPKGRARIVKHIKEGKNRSEIGREFGISATRIRPLLNAVLKETGLKIAERKTERPDAIFIVSGIDGDTINFCGFPGGIPRLYPRDQYPFADALPRFKYIDDAVALFKHFKKKDAGRVQVDAHLLPQFFNQREINRAFDLAE